MHSLFTRFLFALCINGPLFVATASAQQSFDVSPGTPAVLNGIEYGIEVLNEQTKGTKDEEYNRYELGLFVNNKSGCAKLIMPRQTLFGQQTNPALLAAFDCLNATGRRMTSKSGNLSARPFVVPYRQTVKNAEGKDVTTTTNVPAGFVLRNGESVTDRIIVIVPAGEQPRMRVRVQEIIDNF